MLFFSPLLFLLKYVRGRRVALSRPPFLLFLSRLALVIGTHTRVHKHVRKSASSGSKARERKRRDSKGTTTSIDGRHVDRVSQQLSAYGRDRLYLYAYCLPGSHSPSFSFSLPSPSPLSFAPHPPPQCRDEHAYVDGRIRTRSRDPADPDGGYNVVNQKKQPGFRDPSSPNIVYAIPFGKNIA